MCLICFLTASAATAVSPTRETEYRQRVVPLLKTYCVECHSADLSEGEFNMTSFHTAQSILEGRNRWLRVVQRLRNGQMPPEESPALPTSQRDFLADWIEATANDIDCSGTPSPGRPTIRRLNRNEYQNTIRDLTGVEYAPAADFPGDDVGYGFDNIGDVLSLPPLLMEKYLDAAEAIAQQAIAREQPWSPTSKRIRAESMRDVDGKSSLTNGTARAMTSRAELGFDFDFPYDGKYEFSALSWGDQAGDEPAQITFILDGREVKTVDVPAEEEKPGTYVVSVDVKKGSHKVGVAFFNDFYDPKAKDRRRRDRNLYVGHVEIRGPQQAPPAALNAEKKILFLFPSDKTPPAQASRQVLSRFASRAFRRPVSDQEVDRLVALAEIGREKENSFSAGIQLAMQAVLASPHFLFRVESPGEPGADRLLTDYELATALSYFLWSSMPDDELLLLAWEGKLREGDQLERQVRRMIASPKSEALVQNFANQWLELRNLADAAPDADMYPQFNDELRQAMRQETELFFAAVLREDRSVVELVDADFTFLNEPLARHYGVPGVTGKHFRRVSLQGPAGERRGGLLTQASVLTVTSSPTRTSPVKRGKWILDNLLNEPPPPPGPMIPELEDQHELKGTLRQRMEQHRANPSCAACHRVMDQLGFALENFDAVGAWREKDDGAPIDTSGLLPTGEAFRGPAELRRLLIRQKKEAFLRCLAEKLLTYSLGRGLEYYDQCAIDGIVAAAAPQDYRFSSFLLGIVKSEPFQKRRGLPISSDERSTP
ncbi:DUF1592 domain-containing protein [Lignipirellula cremea]|uniref:DUF1592 domain-containing protein n=1 Tax=Lignipirellula cremea TaxID=2528010 RepID=UPI003704C024